METGDFHRFSIFFPDLGGPWGRPWGRYMLEMLSRPYPRRQVLVTADPKLAEPGALGDPLGTGDGDP